MRILLVDDDPVSLRVMRAAVRAVGHAADVADSGESALARLADDPAEGVVTDHLMSGMDGAELGRRVRALPGGAQIFLMLVTGLDETAAARIARDAGFDAFLTKPIDLGRLEDLLAKAASLRS